MSGNDLIQMAQGAGKSHVIAEYAKAINEDVLILQPSQELVEQNMDKLAQIVPEAEIGVYSASLNRKEIKKYTFATIGSVYKKPEQFIHFRTVIIDEVHLLSPKATGSMFMKFLSGMYHPKVIGFTASPFRLATRLTPTETLYGNRQWYESTTVVKMINRTLPLFWNRLLYTISTQELIDMGYLVHLTYVDKKLIDQMDIPINKSKSDFDTEAYEELIEDKTPQIIEVLKKIEASNQPTLVFCCSQNQAADLSREVVSEVVTAKTPKKRRKQIVADFKSGKVKIVFTVQALGTGFDYPNLRVIVLLRPTKSVGLYLQLLGRGSRLSPETGKRTCVVIDFTDTVQKLGEIETFRVVKLDTGWDVISSKGKWHGKELYSFVVKSTY